MRLVPVYTSLEFSTNWGRVFPEIACWMGIPRDMRVIFSNSVLLSLEEVLVRKNGYTCSKHLVFCVRIAT
jgi:hypothetical protein